MMIDTAYLSLLGCPKCKGALQQPEEANHLQCPSCQLDFGIEDGVAVLLLERATASEGKP